MNKTAIARLAPRESTLHLSDELIAAFRQRIAQNYYDQPEVIEIVARAILHARFFRR